MDGAVAESGAGGWAAIKRNARNGKNGDQEEKLIYQGVELCRVHPLVHRRYEETRHPRRPPPPPPHAGNHPAPRVRRDVGQLPREAKGPQRGAEQEQQQRQAAAQEKEKWRCREEQTEGPRREQQRWLQESLFLQKMAAARILTAELEGEGHRDERPPKRRRRSV